MNKNEIGKMLEKDIMEQIIRDAPSHWGDLTGYTTLDSLAEHLNKTLSPSEMSEFKRYWSLANLKPSNIKGGNVEEIKTRLETSIKIMEFENPIFHNGINCTVRFGYKWANLKIGERIILQPSAHEAIIRKIMICRFSDLDEVDIYWEHDPKCRTIRGLHDCLSSIYHQMIINKRESIIIVVYFTILAFKEEKGGKDENQ